MFDLNITEEFFEFMDIYCDSVTEGGARYKYIDNIWFIVKDRITVFEYGEDTFQYYLIGGHPSVVIDFVLENYPKPIPYKKRPTAFYRSRVFEEKSEVDMEFKKYYNAYKESRKI